MQVPLHVSVLGLFYHILDYFAIKQQTWHCTIYLRVCTAAAFPRCL